MLTVDGVGGVINRCQSKRVQFQLRAECGKVFAIEESTMKLVASPTPITDWSQEKQNWPQLRGLPVGVVGGKVDLLVGTDYLHLLVAVETRGGQDYEPIACKTRLGWIVREVIFGGHPVSSIHSCTIAGQIPLDNFTVEVRI